jgi:hypothetical protein
LAGMAPYVVNAGLEYQGKNVGLSVNYGTSGRKITQAGPSESEDEYEAPRHLLDCQISCRLFRNRVEIKANASDILHQPVILYSNFHTGESSTFVDADKNYNEGVDLLRSKIRKGMNGSFSVSWTF